jgi:hypothetical protein
LEAITNRATAAKMWLAHGYSPMPVLPGQKATRSKHTPWLEMLSDRSVDVHWSTHPTDDIALHCGKGLTVLDADSPESLDAMLALETKHGLQPKMVVNTQKGVHHYFRQAQDLRIKSAGYSTAEHPERIDVRCGSAYIIAPPSTGKTLATEEVVRFEDLTLLTQEFVDELFVHNGDRPLTERPEREVMDDCGEFGEPVDVSVKVARMRALLEHIDPEEGYSAWLQVLMAIHHETGGSDEGLELADEWSSKGGSYDGIRSIEQKWASFNAGSSTPVTMASLVAIVNAQGLDSCALCAEADDPFESCEMEVLSAPAQVATAKRAAVSLLDYSLQGKLEEVRKYAVDATPLLGSLALKGQFTVFFADANVGKTLVMLRLLVDAIQAERIRAGKVIYVNLDDGANGLLEKGEIAEEFGFHEVAVGYQGFTMEKFFESVKAMTENKEASGTLLILDTLKKFTDVMNKTQCVAFGELIRGYTAVGGTVLALGHTNKNPDSRGKPVPSGTADITQDADCTFTMQVEVKGGERVVTFENKKKRGSVPDRAQFAYAVKPQSYRELLDTVHELTVDDAANEFQAVPQENPEDRMIRAFQEVIDDGCIGKTPLIEAVRKLTSFSKAKVEAAHHRYCGSDPSKHHWDFTLGDRGAHHYFLLETETADVVDDDPF